MADAVTANYSFVKPEVGASADTWGGKLNDNFDDLDTLIKSVSDAIPVAGTGAGNFVPGNAAVRIASHAAVSVVGRSANSTGDVADIAASANDRVLARTSDAVGFVQITVGMITDAVITFAKMATAAVATFAEFNTATASKLLSTASVWADCAVLTDGANIAVNFNNGYDFSGASNAALALGGNRTLDAPTNARNGKKGILWFTATGSTRTLTLNAAWVLAAGVEAGPYSITTSQVLGIAYAIRGTTVYVTAIVRIG